MRKTACLPETEAIHVDWAGRVVRAVAALANSRIRRFARKRLCIRTFLYRGKDWRAKGMNPTLSSIPLENVAVIRTGGALVPTCRLAAEYSIGALVSAQAASDPDALAVATGRAS